MMYNEKLAAAIKVNGKVLREFKDTVYIPFGSEYSILVKNLNTVRAIVNIFIDGDNIVPGGLVLNAGQEIDLERSIKNNNLTEGNKLKFIERTGAVEQHRGIKLEDGIVRIEYQFEKVFQRQDGIMWKGATDQRLDGNYYGGSFGQPVSTPTYSVGGAMRSVDFSKGEFVKAAATSAVNQYCVDNNIKTMSAVHDGIATMDCSFNDAGITVPGSKSEQKFSTASWFATETAKHTIILKLLGETPDNKQVRAPVTVKAKPKCETCGKLNKANAKFCSECGTALEIFA